MVYKVLAPAQRVQSSHSGVTEIVRFLMICSSPLAAVGYLLHEVFFVTDLQYNTVLLSDRVFFFLFQ